MGGRPLFAFFKGVFTMAIKLSSNPTCVLSDADNLTPEQRQKINLNLSKGIPGSDIEGDKVTVINSEGEVEMKAYSAGGGGGSSYTAGNGIAINDSGVVSVNHDATLADKAPTRTLTPNYTQHAIVDKGYWYALEYDLTGVEANDTVTFKFGGPYGYDQSGSITMSICDSDPNLYAEDYGSIRLIMAKPTGDSPVGQTDVALGTSDVGEGNLGFTEISLPAEVTGMVSSLFDLGQHTLDDFKDENGKVLVYLGVYNSDDGKWVTASSCHGPLDSIGLNRYAVVQLAYSKDYEGEYYDMDGWNVTGALDVPTGAAKLSVSNPLPTSTSYDNGKVLKVSNGQASWQSDTVPYYDYLNIGKMLGVTGDPDKHESQLSWVDPLPAWDAVADEGKVLKIVSGSPAWVTP
jgi:hypothetical protein